VRHTVEGIGEAVEVDGMLRSRRRRRAPGEAIEVEGKAVETTACSRGDAVEGALCRRRHAPGIGGVEDLKRASDENLLSVEWATCAPDIYIRGQMRDACSLRHVAHFLGVSRIIFR
jgi:hypothetical protein